MTDRQTKRVVVVLSAGRSGTSLLMKILSGMGMELSENMIPGSVGNPEGFFEDADIVGVHKKLLAELGTAPTLPLPPNWLDAPPTMAARKELRAILDRNLASPAPIWGFKDPRTAGFLPLWNKILNAPGTVPVFVVAMRDPASVASSLKRQINRDESITELQWLQRTTDSIYHTGGDCFIVHYEDWFTRPLELAQELLHYTGLDKHFSGSLEDLLASTIKTSLNRAVHEGYEARNEYVLRLHDVVKDCRGDYFDRERLLSVVNDCRKVMDSFKSWYTEGKKQRAPSVNVEKLENELAAITAKYSEALRGMKDAVDQKEDLRIRVIAAQQELRSSQQELHSSQQELASVNEALSKKGRAIASLEGLFKTERDKRVKVQKLYERECRATAKAVKQLGKKADSERLAMLHSINYAMRKNLSYFKVNRETRRTCDIIRKSKLFDVSYYSSKHPDIIASGQDPLEHWVKYGWMEFRNPNMYFDTFFYLSKNKDVLSSFTNPLVHFITHGWKEKRDPGPLFSVSHYLATYPEVLESGLNPLAHYLLHGKAEGRSIGGSGGKA